MKWKVLGYWTTEGVERCKLILVDYPRRSLADSRAESHVDYGGPAQELSEGNNNCNWAIEHSCGTLAKNVAALCPHPENLPEAKF